ncbi:hypothetical protein [Streptococcus pneumoniae]|uniref:hypothetical protein n=1 Tax=Streptococcus pneumoniae TaxID=1313 RepID=UPI000B18D6C5|nr:hypothetical protein [Streptococcus pneumoniae]
MNTIERTRRLVKGCATHCFEVVDRTERSQPKHCFGVADETDEVSSKYCFEVQMKLTKSAQNMVLRFR